MENAEQVQVLSNKIMELAGNGELRFKHEFNTPEELLATGAHNTAEFERIEAMGTELPYRVWDLVCLLMAEAWRSVITKSDDPEASLRQFLLNEFSQTKYAWGKTKRLAKEAFIREGFTGERLELSGLFMDAIFRRMIDKIVESVAPIYLIPKGEDSKFTGILVEMFKEIRGNDDLI